MNEPSPYTNPDNSASDAFEIPSATRSDRASDRARMFRIWQGDEADRETEAVNSVMSTTHGNVGPLDGSDSSANESLVNPATRSPQGSGVRGTAGDGRLNQEAGQEEEGDDSDDIEAYMEQWLRRVRGESDEGADKSAHPRTERGVGAERASHLAASEPKSSKQSAALDSQSQGAGASGSRAATNQASTTSSISSLESTLEQDSTAPGATTDRLGIPRELLPAVSAPAPLRSGKVERPAELKALREVANVSARSAINGSLKKQFRQEFRSKATVSGVALLVGGVLYWLGEQQLSVLSAGAAACALISLFWGLRIVGDWLRMRRQRSTS